MGAGSQTLTVLCNPKMRPHRLTKQCTGGAIPYMREVTFEAPLLSSASIPRFGRRLLHRTKTLPAVAWRVLEGGQAAGTMPMRDACASSLLSPETG